MRILFFGGKKYSVDAPDKNYPVIAFSRQCAEIILNIVRKKQWLYHVSVISYG